MKKYLKTILCFIFVVACCTAMSVASLNASAASDEKEKWVCAWGTAPTQISIDGFSEVSSLVGEVTARIVLTPTASGERFRIKVSNYYGTLPLKVKYMSVAYSKGESVIDVGSLKYITFENGSPEITLNPGEELYSDPVHFKVTAQQPIAISIYIDQFQDVGTMGLTGASTYITTGEAIRTEDYNILPLLIDDEEMLDVLSKLLEGFTGKDSINLKLAYSFIKIVPVVTSLDVLTDGSGYSVVAVGDSTISNEFPLYLSQSLYESENVDNVGIVDKGVIGNRLLGEGLGLNSFIFAESMLTRFRRDVLEQSGVEYVIMKIGANDIMHPVCQDIIEQYPGIKQPTAEDIIEGYRKIFRDCHDAGVKVVVMSITQWKGATRDYFGTGAKYVRTEAQFREDWQIAKDVNEWLANTDEHDGFVNLNDISANPLDEDAFLPEYTIDGIHPSVELQKLWSNSFPFSLIGVGKKPGGLRLEQTDISIFAGEYYQLSAIVLPETAENKSLLWESSDPEIASVDENGIITGVSNGNAFITCKTVVGGFEARCLVRVTTKPESITLDYTEREIYTTKSVTLVPTVLPENAIDKSVSWSSSNEKVATVDNKGVVVGVGTGTAVITAKTNVGGLSAKCTVIVNKKNEVQTVTISCDGLDITKKTLYTNDTNSAMFVSCVSPSNATFKDVVWSSSDKKVVTVDPLGNVKVVGAGKAVIKCTSVDNPMAVGSVAVTVKVRATDIELSSSSFRVYETKSKTLKATIFPEDASNKTVKWSSSNTKVAKVDKNGKVTGVKPGTVYITGKTANGKYTDKCKVTVLEIIYAEKVKLNKTKLTLDDGKSYTLKATISPSDVTYDTVKWTSKNTKVAKVSSSGKVTAVNPGTTYIYCKTTDNGTTAKCKVTVKEVKPTSVSFSKKSITVDYKDPVTLKATVSPSNATDKGLTWSSSNSKIVKVTSSGKITGLMPGKSATITVKTKTGGFTAKIKVKVNEIDVTKVSLNRTSVTLGIGKTTTLSAIISPSEATDKSLSWSSSNKKVATVSSSGKVTAVSEGTAVITCKSENGKKATCTIKVKFIEVEGLKLDKTDVRAEKGATFTIKASVMPSNATNPAVSWKSSDKSVAKVSSKGVVTAVSQGTCQIICTSKDGEYTALCIVTVI